MSVAVSCVGLCCQSGRRRLLDRIDWEVRTGEHWVVFGLNGSGKTTLLSAVAGWGGYTKGDLQVFGERYSDDNVLLLRRRIGWVSSSFFDKYLSRESAFDVVLSGAVGTLSGGWGISDADRRRALRLLDALGVARLRDQPFALLSKGERQCVLIARALESDPELLILDEPGTGLDIRAREYVMGAVCNMAEHTGKTIIYVTHYAEEILPPFDHALLLRDGRVWRQGRAEELFTQEILEGFLDEPLQVSRDAAGHVQIKLLARPRAQALLEQLGGERAWESDGAATEADCATLAGDGAAEGGCA